jgi:hypothetical protein
MKLEPRALSLVLVAILSGACASTARSGVTPLEGARASPARLHVRPSVGGAELEVAASPAGGESSASLRVRLYSAEPEWIELALGDPYVGAFGVTSSRAQVERLCAELERLGATPIAVPRDVALAGDGRGSVAVLRQFAYVSGFDVHVEPRVAAIGDPRIAVANEGFRLDVAVGDPAPSLELELTVCDLQARRRDMKLFRTDVPVRVDELQGEARTLRVAATVGGDEALVFGGTGVGIGPARGGLIGIVEVDRGVPGTR